MLEHGRGYHSVPTQASLCLPTGCSQRHVLVLSPCLGASSYMSWGSPSFAGLQTSVQSPTQVSHSSGPSSFFCPQTLALLPQTPQGTLM